MICADLTDNAVWVVIMLELTRLSENFLKLLWVLRLYCLKPIAHRCMVVTFGRQYFSILLISWKSRIMMVFGYYLMNLDGAVRLHCLYITTFTHLTLFFANWFMLYGKVVTQVLIPWFINCLRQTFICSLNCSTAGGNCCTKFVCCFYFFFYILFYFLAIFNILVAYIL